MIIIVFVVTTSARATCLHFFVVFWNNNNNNNNNKIWATDLLVPCIVEGRSELRNAGRVNCKTHWPISFGLRNTLLTERFIHFAVCLISSKHCSALGWVYIDL